MVQLESVLDVLLLLLYEVDIVTALTLGIFLRPGIARLLMC